MGKKARSAAAVAPAPRLPKEIFIVAFILGVALLTYLRALGFAFVYDDQGQIVQNPFVQSWHYLPQFFVSQVWKNLYPQTPGNYYRPVFLLWALLNHSLFGLWAPGWHLTTILLHLVATALCYLLVRKLTASPVTAALAALLFGVHPVHLEVVVWVSGATESLHAVLFLLAFLAYLQSREGRRGKWMALSCGIFAAALLCKETAVILPLVVFAHAWIYGESEGAVAGGLLAKFRRAFLVVLPYVPVGIAYLILRISVLQGLGHALVKLSPSVIVFTWPSVLLFYIRLLVWPVGLSEFYDLSYITRLDATHVVLPALVVLLVAIGLWYWQRRSETREVRFAVVWLVAPILPLLNLSVLEWGDFAHDRYLYLSSIGFVLLVALALQKLGARGKRFRGFPARPAFATLAIAAVLCFGTVLQSSPWANDFALYTHAVQTAPHSSTALNNLANEYTGQGQYQQARALYERVLNERPDYWNSIYNLGYLDYKSRNLPEAEKYFQRAIQVDPSVADEYFYLGLTQLRMGRATEAVANIRRAIAVKPDSPNYHFALGETYLQSGDCANARPEFQAELALNPASAAAAQELAKCDHMSASR